MMVSDDGERFSVPATPLGMHKRIRSASIPAKSFSVLVPVMTFAIRALRSYPSVRYMTGRKAVLPASMRCRMTAIFRARATRAFLPPTRLASLCAHAFKGISAL